MRSISLLVLTLVLVSLSSQHQLSFQEFVQGHEGYENSRDFVIVTSSDAKFNKLAKGKRMIVRSFSNTEYAFFGPCSTCKKDSMHTPFCTSRNCLLTDRYLQRFAYHVIFTKSYLAAEFWKRPASGQFKIAVRSDSLTFQPIN